MDVLSQNLLSGTVGGPALSYPGVKHSDESILPQLCTLALQAGSSFPSQYVQLLSTLYASQAVPPALSLFDKTLTEAKVFPTTVSAADKLKDPLNTKTLENQTALALAGLQNHLPQCGAPLSFGLTPYSLPQTDKPLPERKRKYSQASTESEASKLAGKVSEELTSRVTKLVALLEKVERPRTWTQEETFCVVLVVVQNESLVKQARYKELHLEFQEHVKSIFNQDTKKTRQAFWARHCRIREKLGAEEYEQLFWKGKDIPSQGSPTKKLKWDVK